jgi:DNA-binding CsgD family transcriptional regulator
LNGSAQQSHFLSVLGACHSIASSDSFMANVYPALKRLIPHERFICGIATVKSTTVTQVINVGFPAGYVNQQVGRDGSVRSPLIRYWLSQKVHAPVHFDDRHTMILRTPADWAWRDVLTRHRIQNLAAHGQLDVSGMAMSYFCFGDHELPSQQLDTLLRLVVPHLHIAVSHSRLFSPARDSSMLSLREQDVLKLVCKGKTNNEIAAILGISAWTVKIHVRNFMCKLDVSTRGHAVAKAMQYGLVS